MKTGLERVKEYIEYMLARPPSNKLPSAREYMLGFDGGCKCAYELMLRVVNEEIERERIENEVDDWLETLDIAIDELGFDLVV